MQTFTRYLLVFVLFTAVLAPVTNASGAASAPIAAGPAAVIVQAKAFGHVAAFDQTAQIISQAPNTVQYYNGLTQYSSIINCVSIIQGTPYYEYGIGTYVGFAADPQAALPGPGMIYYIHIVMAGMGNSCSGQRVYLDFQLPASTTLAISGSTPVICYSNGVRFATSECPQALPASTLNPGAYVIPSIDSAHAYTWPMPQGWTLEFQVPVVSSGSLTNSTMQANIWALDGNSNPWLRPQEGVYVFSNTPSLFYPSPSTDAITATSVTSHATLYSHGQSGTVYFDLGLTASYGLFTVSGTIAAGSSAWLLDSSWPGFTFTPNTVYHWRARFVSDTGPTTYYGADQTFQTLPDGQVTVGSGAAASCTQAAFDAAIGTPGAKQIVFNCGPAEVTIPLSGAKTITSSLTIDGGNTVVLQGNNTFRLFDVAAPAILTLNKLTLTGGNVTGCGGAVHIQTSASLIANYVRLTNNNASGTGGALCLEANGSAELTNVFITANHASGDGGGIYNAGLVDLMWSEVSGNSTAGTGSGGGAYNSGAIYFITSLLASNQTVIGSLTRGQQSGGGLYNSGNASFFASTIANNTASYGGGIFNNGGTVSTTNVTIAANISNNNRKNAEFQAGGLDSIISGNAYLRNTLIAGNSAGGAPGNCGTSPQNTIVSQGNNLDSGNQCGFNQPTDKVNTDPLLIALANNGGPTRTMALAFRSPAIDAGDNAYCGMYDQRGFSGPAGGQTLARQVDGNGDGIAVCDIGAYEDHPQVFIPLVRR